jgi:hypothetical protein
MMITTVLTFWVIHGWKHNWLQHSVTGFFLLIDLAASRPTR